jgi:hypothetical protein
MASDLDEGLDERRIAAGGRPNAIVHQRDPATCAARTAQASTARPARGVTVARVTMRSRCASSRTAVRPGCAIAAASATAPGWSGQNASPARRQRANSAGLL